MNGLLFAGWMTLAAAAPAAAWLDLSPEDPAWLEQDRAARESFARHMESALPQDLLWGVRVDEYFREAPPAGVEARIEEARQSLQRGREFYELLKPERAIQHLQAALKTLREIGAGMPDLSLLEETHFLLGMTFQALGQTSPADDHYRMVLLLRPDRALDEAAVNPLVVERFERVRQNLAASLPGSISIISTPAGGRVGLDGRPVGRTPLTLSGLSPGEHYLSLAADGYRPWFGLVLVPSGGLEKKEIYPEEGARIERVRLRDRLFDVGAINAPLADAQSLCRDLGTSWLILTRLFRREGKTFLEAGVYSSSRSDVGSLGPYPSDDASLAQAARDIAAWMRGERPQRLVVRPPELPPVQPPIRPLPPPPAATPWYRTWWFWTAVGSVAAGAAAVTAGVLLSRDQGVRIEVLR